MIIDFFGLPGSGKSYLVEQIAKELKIRNYNAINYIKFERNFILGKILRRVFEIIIINTKSGKWTRKKISHLLHNCFGNSSCYDENIKIEYYINRLVYLIFFYEKARKSKKIYLFDEGIINVIISIGIHFQISIKQQNQIIDICLKALKEATSVYNLIDIEDCFESIKKRNRHKCCIDELVGDDLLSMLEMYKLRCDNVAKYYPVLIVRRNDETINKIDKILMEYE